MCTTGVGAKITVPTDGYYLVTASAQCSTTATLFYIYCALNGTAVVYGDISGASAATELSVLSGVVKCVATDILTIVSGTTTTAVGGNATQFTVTWIAPA